MSSFPELTILETISAQADRFTLFEVQELIQKKLLAVETEVWCESKSANL